MDALLGGDLCARRPRVALARPGLLPMVVPAPPPAAPRAWRGGDGCPLLGRSGRTRRRRTPVAGLAESCCGYGNPACTDRRSRDVNFRRPGNTLARLVSLGPSRPPGTDLLK